MINNYNVSFNWLEGDISVFVPVLLALVFFTAYWFITKSESVKYWFTRRYDADKASVYHITFNRITGFAAMGVLPVSVCLMVLPDWSLGDYGLRFDSFTRVYTVAWTVILSLLVMPAAFFSARKPANLVNYPMIRARIWTRETVIINTIGWALYLLGYEFLFRGVLLVPLAEVLGVWPAVAVNVALYSATHIPKGLAETIGAAPLGLVLCLLTLNSGTIWIAFLVHLAMALTNSFTALKYNPDMKYQSGPV